MHYVSLSLLLLLHNFERLFSNYKKHQKEPLEYNEVIKHLMH